MLQENWQDLPFLKKVNTRKDAIEAYRFIALYFCQLQCLSCIFQVAGSLGTRQR